MVGVKVELCQFMVLPEFFRKLESRLGTRPKMGWVWRVEARRPLLVVFESSTFNSTSSQIL